MLYVILVNYNGADDTIECIESLSLQRARDFEIIVVDNNSTDNSVERLKKISVHIILLVNEENLGFSGGNNVGIKYAIEHGAEGVILLNNDTVVSSDFIDSYKRTVNKHHNSAVIGPKIKYYYQDNIIWYAGGEYNGKTGRVEHTGYKCIDKGEYDTFKEVSFISGCCIYIPTSVIKRIGFLDERYFLYCEDLEYCCRLQRNKIKMFYDPQIVVLHKVSASTDKISGSSIYYTVRNGLYVIKEYHNKGTSLLPYLYYICQALFRCIKGEYRFKPVLNGIIDMVSGKVGKKG